MYRTSHRVLTAVVFLATVSPAWGQTEVDSARAAAERGRREYNLGHWQLSIDGFEKAYQLSGDPALLFNLGLAHRQLGHVGEALRLYRTYLREKPDAPNRDLAEKQIKELEAAVPAAPTKPTPPAPPTAPAATRPTPQAPPTAPAAAKPTPQAPPTAPGQPAPPAPRPAVGPAATSPVAPTAPSTASSPAPAPTVAPAPPPGAILTVPAAPPPARATPLPRWLPLVGAILTVAAATGAAVTGLSASSRYNDLKATCGQTAEGCTSEQIDGVRSRDRTATILWVSAGVLAAATGVSVVVNTHAAGASALWRF